MREPVLNFSGFKLASIVQCELRRFHHAEAAARGIDVPSAADESSKGGRRAEADVSNGKDRGGRVFRRISVENSRNTDDVEVRLSRCEALGPERTGLSANGNATSTTVIWHHNLASHAESPSNRSQQIQQIRTACSDPSTDDSMVKYPRIHKGHTPMKEGKIRSNSHFRYTSKRICHDRHKQLKMLRMHLERHPYLRGVSSKLWLDGVLRSLHKVKPVDADAYVKRTEIIPLAAGSKAVFKATTREAVLDILLRTGCNVHPVSGRLEWENARDKERNRVLSNASILNQKDSTDSNFDAIVFTGSQQQIRAAIDIIPNMIKMVDPDAGPSTECREVQKDSTQTFAQRSDKIPWIAQESDYHDIGSAIHHSGKRPSNPNPESKYLSPVPIRVVWARDRKRSSAYQESLLRRCFDGACKDKGTILALERLRPPIESAITFAAYVDDLTNLPPRLLRRRLQTTSTSGEPIHFFRQVITELISIFQNPRFQDFVSGDAAEYALQFLMKYSDYHAAQLVFDALLRNKTYMLNSSIFDALLETAAKNHDMHNFRWLVSTMARLRVVPSWKTWVCLYDLACRCLTSDIAARILQRMSSTGVLDVPQALRETVCSNVERDLIRYLLQNQNASLNNFVEWYDERFGRKMHGDMNSRHRDAVEPRMWLSTSTANRMIKVLLLQGRNSDAMEVVRMLEAAGEHPDTATLNTFLTDARRARNPSVAVTMLKQLSCYSQNQNQNRWHAEIVLDELSYANLFDIAWKGRYYNMVRVIWRYACCSGQMIWDVQQRVRQSLLTYLPAPTSSSQRKAACLADTALHGPRGERQNKQKASAVDTNKGLREQRFSLNGVFYGMAGKFAVGISDHTISPSQSASSILQQTARERELATLAAVPRTVRDISQSNSEENTSVNGTTVSDPKHVNRERQLLGMIRADILAAGAVRPLMPFADILEQALKKDLEWRARGFGMLNRDHFDKLKLLPDSNEEAKTKMFADILDAMLSEGLRVPMIVKDPSKD